jgi:hypothetical protein
MMGFLIKEGRRSSPSPTAEAPAYSTLDYGIENEGAVAPDPQAEIAQRAWKDYQAQIFDGLRHSPQPRDWALAFVRITRDYEPDEKIAREAKAGMWQGAFIAPWDWRVRNKKTHVLGAVKPPENANAILLASASGPVAPSPDCTIKGNVNRSGECIYHTPASRWYAKIQMHVSKGTRWFCSVEDAEAAGCRETKR